MAIVEIQYQRDPATGAVLFDASGNPLIVPDSTANTFAQMQTRVLYEVLGPATQADAANAINDAIASYEAENFWFNDMRTFDASAGLHTDLGQEFYSAADLPALANMPHIRSIYVLAFNNRYPLRQRSQEWIADQSVSQVWQGLPTDWCWSSNGLRIYPVPNGVYPLIIEGTIRFPPLVNDTDYNAWTNRGERLIRTEAKRLIYENIARDQGQAQVMEQQVLGIPGSPRLGYLAELRRETSRRAGGTGRLRPSRGYL